MLIEYEGAYLDFGYSILRLLSEIILTLHVHLQFS